GAERVERQAALQRPLGTRDFSSAQTSRDANLDALCAETLRFVHCLAHRAAECDTLFELLCDLLGLKLRVEFRFVYLAYVDQDFPLRSATDLLFQFIDFCAFATDDNARARRMNNDTQAIGRAIDFDL